MESYVFLLSIAIIMLTTKIMGDITNKANMPQVVGALLAGVLVGPSCLGLIEETDFITKTAEIGVILLMFTAGMETDMKEMKKNSVACMVIATIGVVVPLLGGTACYYFYFEPGTVDYEMILKAVFIGVVLTATSVSITVEALREMGKLEGKVGSAILGAAVIDDIMGIIVLTVVMSMKDKSISIVAILGKILLYTIIMVVLMALLRKYKEKIDIFCGLEFDQYSDDDRQGYDYIIGANHYLKLGDKFVGFDRGATTVQDVIRDYFDGDGLKFAKEYYSELAELPKYGDFDIVGHFDLITKNCELAPLFDENDEKYKKYALDCLYALKDKILVFEINTGAMARGYRKTPYPRSFILKEMVKAGVGITLSSDCHNNEFLSYGFEESLQLCKACGVKELQILTKGGFKGLALE